MLWKKFHIGKVRNYSSIFNNLLYFFYNSAIENDIQLLYANVKVSKNCRKKYVGSLVVYMTTCQ